VPPPYTEPPERRYPLGPLLAAAGCAQVMSYHIIYLRSGVDIHRYRERPSRYPEGPRQLLCPDEVHEIIQWLGRPTTEDGHYISTPLPQEAAEQLSEEQAALEVQDVFKDSRKVRCCSPVPALARLSGKDMVWRLRRPACFADLARSITVRITMAIIEAW